MAEGTNIPVFQEGTEQPVQATQEAINIQKLDGAVNSVNGMEGDVILTAEDVGALPDTTPIPSATSDLVNDSDFVSMEQLAPVATSGAYSDLVGKPTIPTVNNASLTIRQNGDNLAVFTANSSTNQTADITVPTAVTDLSDASDYAKKTAVATDIANEKTARENADTALQTAIGNEVTARKNADTALTNSVNTIDGAINKVVMTDLAVDANGSTTVVQLDSTKTNIKTSATTTSNLPLPVASATQAGVMNAATYQALTQNTQDINSLINGAVAVTGLPASPTQPELTAAWKTATGLTTLINRAGIYDVTNTKYWTYYTNDTTWHYTTGSASVTINTFTNSSEGVIKGSTTAGQVFAENDGTGSVNGWDTLSGAVADHTSKLATIASGAEVNVQADWSEVDTTADSYIQNKPSLATVATSGSYNDLTNQPTIPTTVAQLSDASSYYTAAETDTAIATAIGNITDYDSERF